MPSDTASAASRQTQLRRRRGAALLLLLVIATAVWGWRSSQRRGLERLLAEARAALNRLRAPSPEAVNHGTLIDDTRWMLEDYVAAGGDEASSAELLLELVRTLQSPKFASTVELKPRQDQSTADLLLAAELLFHAGHWPQSDGLLTEVLARNEERRERRAEALRLAATVRYELVREDDVLACCQELKQITPEDARPWIAEAQVHEDRSHWPQVFEACREAVRLQPDRPNLRWKLAEACIRVGNTREARAALDAIPMAAGSEDTRRLMDARILELEGHSEESLAIAEELLEKYPEHVDSLLLKGRQLLGMGKLPEAQKVFEELIRLDPVMQEAHYSLGQVYARRGERDKANVEFAVHRQLADRKMELYRLERQAGREPANRELRERIAGLYDEIGLTELAQFWRRASGDAGSPR